MSLDNAERFIEETEEESLRKHRDASLSDAVFDVLFLWNIQGIVAVRPFEAAARAAFERLQREYCEVMTQWRQ